MTNDWGTYKNAGAPEGVVTGNIGSICCDTTNGNVYKKSSGTGNTGWVELGLATTLPRFAGQAASVNNVTGDGTFYTVPNYTEYYDIGSNFNATTGIFTAPTAGAYNFYVNSFVTNLQANHIFCSMIVEYNAVQAYVVQVNGATVRHPSNALNLSGVIALQLNAGNPVKFVVQAQGGSKVAGVSESRFSGFQLA